MKSPQDARDYWNNLAGTINFTIPLKNELIHKYFPLDAQILDYGCGYGRTMQHLWEMGYRSLLGVDFSATMITRGRQTYPHLNLRVATGDELARDHPLFDVILLFAVLTCIPKNPDQRSLIKNLLRILRPGGFLYVTDFLLNDDMRNRARYTKFQEKYGTYGVFELEGGGIVRHHDPQWIQKLFSTFKPWEYGIETFTTMLGHPARGFYYLGQK